MCTSFCPQCGGDFLNDGPVCEICKAKAARLATVSRLINKAPDDDGEVFTSSLDAALAPEGYKLAAEMRLAASNERMAASGDDPFGEEKPESDYMKEQREKFTARAKEQMRRLTPDGLTIRF